MKEGRSGQEKRDILERTNKESDRRNPDSERKNINSIIEKRKNLTIDDDSEDFIDYNIEDDFDELYDEIEDETDSVTSDMYRKLMKNTVKIESHKLK